MAYKLHQLKKRIPGIAGDMPGKPATPLSPEIQRNLDLAIAVNEGFLTESGTPRSQRALEELALDDLHRADRAKKLGSLAVVTE